MAAITKYISIPAEGPYTAEIVAGLLATSAEKAAGYKVLHDTKEGAAEYPSSHGETGIAYIKVTFEFEGPITAE